MKKLFLLFLSFPFLIFSQNQQFSEEYDDGRLIKTLVDSGVQVTSSLRSIQRNDGKYYMFDISVSNNSDKTLVVKVKEFKAYAVEVNQRRVEKGKKNAYEREALEILRSKDYQEKKRKRGVFRRVIASMGANSAAEDAGRSSSTSNTQINSNSYTSGNGNANINGYDAYGNPIGSATVNKNYSNSNSTSTNASTSTQSYNGAAAYAARQNEERKLKEFYMQQEAAKKRWNDAYIKSNTLSPFETMSGLLNVKFEKGDYIELYVIVQDLSFKFDWNPDDAER